MVVKQSDCRELEAFQVRGGQGQAYSKFLAKGTGKSSLRAMAVNRLPPSHSWGIHRHKADEEFFFILSGTAEVLEKGDRVQLGAGDLFYALPGETFAIRNAGQDDLIFLAGMIKPASAIFF
jgi:mannose-6-phosphate isomerase-like protein (cupin superfamily)